MQAAASTARRPTSRSEERGSGTGFTTILSRPTGFGPKAGPGKGLNNVICSASIIAFEAGFCASAKLPNVTGTVPETVNTTLPLRRPVKVQGIGVTLEYRNSELNVNVEPASVTATLAVSVPGPGNE